MIPKNHWMFVVPLLLAAHVSLMSWAVAKATRDPNGAIIPDYYNKSLRWDAERMERAAHALPTPALPIHALPAQPLPTTRP